MDCTTSDVNDGLHKKLTVIIFIEYKKVLEKLEKLEGESSLWSWVLEKWYEDEQEKLDEYRAACQSVFETRQSVDDLYEFVSDWREVLDLYFEVESHVQEYLATLQSESNPGYYERGLLVVPAASVLVEGVGVLTKMPKVKAALRGIKKLIDKGEWRRFVSKVDEVSNRGVTIRFSKSFVASLNGFSDNIAVLTKAEGIDISTFKALQSMTADNLTIAQRGMMNRIRSNIAHLDDITIIQKVIHRTDISNYITGKYTNCRGYVSTAADSKHLRTLEDIYYGMRLDYKGSKFSASDESCGLIRFKADNASKAEVPRSLINGGNITDPEPFTGHGFTASGAERLAVPEWKMDDWFELQDGAELIELFPDGSEVLRATYSKSVKKFILVR